MIKRLRFNCSIMQVRFWLRICTVFLLLIPCEKTVADVNVELDVFFKDSTQRCRFLYVLGTDSEGSADTLAVFDTLEFNNRQRVSLFYSVHSDSENTISIVDTAGQSLMSKPFKVSSQRTTFVVTVHPQRIKVTVKDYLYPRKNEDEQSYFFFLLIYFVVKVLIAIGYILVRKLPLRLISIASGAFLLGAFIEWFLPLHYFWRFLMTVLVEFLLIAFFGRKLISVFRAGLLTLIVNIIGFGIIFAAYLFYVFF